MEVKPIIIVLPSGEVVIGAGYMVGQVLDAIEVARRTVLGAVLRPERAQSEQPDQAQPEQPA